MPVTTRDGAKKAEGVMDRGGKREIVETYEVCKSGCGHFECHACIHSSAECGLLGETPKDDQADQDSEEEEDNGWTPVGRKLIANSCGGENAPRFANIKMWSGLVQLEELRGFKISITDPETGCNIMKLECRTCGFPFMETFEDYEARKSSGGGVRKSVHVAPRSRLVAPRASMGMNSRKAGKSRDESVTSVCFFCEASFTVRSEYIAHVVGCGGQVEGVGNVYHSTPLSGVGHAVGGEVNSSELLDGRIGHKRSREIRKMDKISQVMFTPRRRREDLMSIKKPGFKKRKKEKKGFCVDTDNLSRFAGAFQKRWR